MGPRYMTGDSFDFPSDFGFSGSQSGDVNPKPHPSQDDGNFGDGTYLGRQNETPQYARGGRHKPPPMKAPPGKPAAAVARPPAIPPQQAAGAVAKALQIGKALGAAKAAMPGGAPPGGALNAMAGPPAPMGGPPPGAMPGGPPMMAQGGAVRDYDAEADIRATESRAQPGTQGGYAHGGAFEGSLQDRREDMVLAKRNNKTMKQWEASKADRKHDKQRSMKGLAKGGKFLAGAIKRPGELHRDLGVPEGKKIPAEKLQTAASRSGKVGQRARLAETMRSFNHRKD